VRPTQAIVILGLFIRHDINGKFYGDRPREITLSGGGVAEYCDFGSIEGYLGNGAI